MTKQNDDIKYHEILKQASGYSYKNGTSIPYGYKVVKSVDNKNTGFHAEILAKDNNIIIAYRGTDITSVQDIKNDIAMAKNKIPKQATEAIKVYDEIKQNYPKTDITVTGHSLGGSLAQIVSSVRGSNAVTFNAYGVKDMFKNTSNIKEKNIINYVNEWDPITMSNAENHLGVTYAVQGKSTKNPHKLETMTYLDSREYRTSEDLKKHKNIFSRIGNKINATTSHCVGSYHVNGYTRADGTKVSDYTRSCGAKHSN